MSSENKPHFKEGDICFYRGNGEFVKVAAAEYDVLNRLTKEASFVAGPPDELLYEVRGVLVTVASLESGFARRVSGDDLHILPDRKSVSEFRTLMLMDIEKRFVGLSNMYPEDSPRSNTGLYVVRYTKVDKTFDAMLLEVNKIEEGTSWFYESDSKEQGLKEGSVTSMERAANLVATLFDP